MSYSDYIGRIQLAHQLSAALKRAEAAEAKVAELEAALSSQQPADDGWIEWVGGECPVKLNAMVEVKHRSEKWCNSRIAAAVADWRHKSWCPDTDIIAYRVVKP